MNKALIVFFGYLVIATADHTGTGYYGSDELGYTGYPGVGITAAPVLFQYHAQDVLGQHSYGYARGPAIKSEFKSADGVKRGGFSYVDENGILKKVQYMSDRVNGFRSVATNLAVAPVATGFGAVPVVAPVQDTPEVAAAKIAQAQANVQAAVSAALD